MHNPAVQKHLYCDYIAVMLFREMSTLGQTLPFQLVEYTNTHTMEWLLLRLF